MIKKLLDEMSDEQKIVFGILSIKKTCEETQSFSITDFEWAKWLKWADGWLANQKKEDRSSKCARECMIHRERGILGPLGAPVFSTNIDDVKGQILNGTYWISKIVVKEINRSVQSHSGTIARNNYYIYCAINCATMAFPGINLEEFAKEAKKY